MPLAPASIGIILNESRTHVLLIKRRDVPVWVLPGGGIDDQETPEQAVIREVWEETGLTIAIQKACAEYYPINRLSALTFVFLCQIQKGQLELSNETAAIDFYPLNQLPSSLFPIHRNWIEEALAATDYIKKPLTQVSYSALFLYFLRHPYQVLRFAITRFLKN
ncbi:NUDIX hydrolase [Candidatus Protochlamydia phocaeensis]|uniref:NUDIX hydrolase n=1 Tax=Candidatus Protochlamydia phocaeensis TaxID=1414722 RepID=UPI0008399EFE|nr:NUDIX hydrolase [Candidatus Protochlamydia phocaeensis]